MFENSNLIPKRNNDRICNTCAKEDVCMYKGELARAAKEINKLSEGENLFVDVDIKCKKWIANEKTPQCAYR